MWVYDWKMTFMYFIESFTQFAKNSLVRHFMPLYYALSVLKQCTNRQFCCKKVEKIENLDYIWTKKFAEMNFGPGTPAPQTPSFGAPPTPGPIYQHDQPPQTPGPIYGSLVTFLTFLWKRRGIVLIFKKCELSKYPKCLLSWWTAVL